MRFKSKERVAFISINNTKNDLFSILVVGAKDFTGTTTFLLNKGEFEENFEQLELIDIEFYITTGIKKVGNDYLEVVKSKKIISMSKAS